MKKTLVVIICLFLLALVGCGKESNHNRSVPNFWVPSGFYEIERLVKVRRVETELKPIYSNPKIGDNYAHVLFEVVEIFGKRVRVNLPGNFNQQSSDNETGQKIWLRFPFEVEIPNECMVSLKVQSPNGTEFVRFEESTGIRKLEYSYGLGYYRHSLFDDPTEDGVYPNSEIICFPYVEGKVNVNSWKNPDEIHPLLERNLEKLYKVKPDYPRLGPDTSSEDFEQIIRVLCNFRNYYVS